jgi:hypothetical protein
MAKRVRQRLDEKRAARITDYIDFNQLDREIVCVAIDAADSKDTKGRVAFEAGRPVAYSDPVHFVDGRWIFAGKKPGDMPRIRPAYVPACAIVGPLPEASTSLRRRPA